MRAGYFINGTHAVKAGARPHVRFYAGGEAPVGRIGSHPADFTRRGRTPAPGPPPHPRDLTMELPSFADEAALFDWVAATLYAAVLSDACDAIGYRDRALGADIRPLDESHVLVGRAKTVVWAPTFHVPSDPYEKEIAAVDSLRPGGGLEMAASRAAGGGPCGGR